jgi:hypothetical protein
VVPPLTGAAVKVTDDPAQIAPAGEAEIDTDGVRLVLTVIVTGELVAVAVVTHVAFDVNTTVTISPLIREADVNVGLLVPVFVPLTLHW